MFKIVYKTLKLFILLLHNMSVLILLISIFIDAFSFTRRYVQFTFTIQPIPYLHNFKLRLAVLAFTKCL